MSRADLRRRTIALIDRLADGSRDDQARDALLADLFAYQRLHVVPYHRLLAARELDDDPLDWPALPTDVFSYTDVSSLEPNAARRTFRTSGTTKDIRGTHRFTDLSLYEHAAKAAAGYALFRGGAPTLISLIPSETEATDSSLAFMIARFTEWFSSSAHYAWRDGGLSLKTFTKAVQEATEPVAVLGTSFACVHLLDQLTEPLPLPEGSFVMQTGGFKGRSREVGPDELRKDLATRFGLAESNVLSEYGMTELSSQMYETTRIAPSQPRRYWAPGWVRIQIVSPESLLPLPPGETGLLRIDDCANLDSVAAIQTSDIGRQVDGGFVLVGRDPNAVPRGCSLAVEDALMDGWP